ncbi:hypothetical protein DIPPA_06828 [Diplonema papillatum]|nr:hypothetical protein DIPPA_06828 [Diplonema papillatum]
MFDDAFAKTVGHDYRDSDETTGGSAYDDSDDRRDADEETRASAYYKIANFYSKRYPHRLRDAQTFIDKYSEDYTALISVYAAKYPDWAWTFDPPRGYLPLPLSPPSVIMKPSMGIKWNVNKSDITVSNVAQNGIAQGCGFQKGMRLDGVGGVRVNGPESLQAAMRELYKNREEKVSVIRKARPYGAVHKALLVNAPVCVREMLLKEPHDADIVEYSSVDSDLEEATPVNIVHSLQWLIRRNFPGDGLFLYLGFHSSSSALWPLQAASVLSTIRTIPKGVHLTIVTDRVAYFNSLPYRLGPAGDGGLEWKAAPQLEDRLVKHPLLMVLPETEGMVVVFSSSDDDLASEFAGLVNETVGSGHPKTMYGIACALCKRLERDAFLSASRLIDIATPFLLGCPPDEVAPALPAHSPPTTSRRTPRKRSQRRSQELQLIQ